METRKEGGGGAVGHDPGWRCTTDMIVVNIFNDADTVPFEGVDEVERYGLKRPVYIGVRRLGAWLCTTNAL